MSKILNWRPDLPDQRDRIFKSTLSAIPDKVDLRAMCSPIENQGSLGSCHDAETEVLTKDGWKLFSDTTLSDKLASVCPKSKSLIFENPVRIVKFPYSGIMYSVENRSINFCVTGDHKMLVRSWEENNRKLSKKFNFISMSSLGWYVGLMDSVVYTGVDNKCSYTIPKFNIKAYPLKNRNKTIYASYLKDITVPMSLWLKFLGIFLAEGTCIGGSANGIKGSSSGGRIQLAAFKAREKNFIRKILTKLNISFNERKDRFLFSNLQIRNELISLGIDKKSYLKRVPDFIFNLNYKYIRIFLNAFAHGDGSFNKNLSVTYWTSSSFLADDLNRLSFLAGFRSSKNLGKPEGSISTMRDGRVVIAKRQSYRIHQSIPSKTSCIENKSIKQTFYSGYVYCAEVPTYHTLVTRRKGKILISGNCSGNAIVGALELIERRNGDGKYTDLSRLFVYYNERVLINTVKEDSGAYLRDGIKVISKTGVCTEVLHPYVEKNFKKKPTKKAFTDASKRLFTSYERITDFASQQKCLADGYPFIFGMTVYDSFMSDEVAKTGIVPVPKASEKTQGGHAVLAVGYDNATKRVIVRNSWGTEWGDGGYFYLPYAFMKNPNLIDDLWTIRG